MEIKKSYRFKNEEAKQDFIAAAGRNRLFAPYLEKGFTVLETMDSGSVSSVVVKNENGTTIVLDARAMGHYGGGPVISCGDGEFHFFKEIEEDSLEENNDDNDYACLVLSSGDGGYLIRQHHCTKKEAEDFAIRWLHDNPKDEVVIIRALSRMTLKTTPTIVTDKF